MNDPVTWSRDKPATVTRGLTGSDAESMTVFVSDSLQARLDTFRERGTNRSATSVTFDAIEHFREELPQLIHDARARLTWAMPEQAEVRYLGTGPVRVRLCPGAAGATLLHRLSIELGLSWRTWLPPVLNAYLPGRREPENMPWLVRMESSAVPPSRQSVEDEMSDLVVEPSGDHECLVRGRQDDDLVVVRVWTEPGFVERLGLSSHPETEIVEVAMAYLLQRQRIDDLPAYVELDEVADFYEDFSTYLQEQLPAGPRE